MKKAVLKVLLSVSGITSLRARWLPPGLYCFNYHRIGDPQACDHDREVFSCSAKHFEQHIVWINEALQSANS